MKNDFMLSIWMVLDGAKTLWIIISLFAIVKRGFFLINNRIDKTIPNENSKKVKIKITLLNSFSSKLIILSPNNIPAITNIEDIKSSKNDVNLFE